MSDLPPLLPQSDEKSVEPHNSAFAWQLGGAVLGAIGLVAGARVIGFPNALLDPFGPLLVAIVALIGANVGALTGLLVARFQLKRAGKAVLTNSEPSLTPPQVSSDKPVKQCLRSLAIMNAGITIGGPIGGIVGWIHLASPPVAAKGEFSMGILLLPFQLIQMLFFLFQVVIFATAGALIGALIGSLFQILRGKR